MKKEALLMAIAAGVYGSSALAAAPQEAQPNFSCEYVAPDSVDGYKYKILVYSDRAEVLQYSNFARYAPLHYSIESVRSLSGKQETTQFECVTVSDRSDGYAYRIVIAETEMSVFQMSNNSRYYPLHFNIEVQQ